MRGSHTEILGIDQLLNIENEGGGWGGERVGDFKSNFFPHLLL